MDSLRRPISALCSLFLALTGPALGQPSTASAGASFESVAALRPLSLAPGPAQDEPAPHVATDSAAPSDWRVDFNAWIWLLGVEGENGVRGQTVDVSANFADILSASDSIFAFSGRLEIGHGQWGFFIDGMYSKLGVEDASGPLGFTDVDVTFEMILIDFGVMYRIGDWEPSGSAADNARNITIDLYVGGRFTDLEIELNPELLPTLEDDVSWLDPIVGAKLVLPLAEQWHVLAMGDVGGFGVASDFTWSATCVFGLDFSLFDHPATLYFGYRAIGQDFSRGSGANEFTWDVVQHGPMLGFAVKF